MSPHRHGDPPPPSPCLVSSPLLAHAHAAGTATTPPPATCRQPRCQASHGRGNRAVTRAHHATCMQVAQARMVVGPSQHWTALGRMRPKHCSKVFLFSRCFIQVNFPENSYAFPKFIENSINIRKIQNKFCWNPL
jgi:hypothetical protein